MRAHGLIAACAADADILRSQSPRRSVYPGTACGGMKLALFGCPALTGFGGVRLSSATFPLLHGLAFHAPARRPCCARENAIEGPAFRCATVASTGTKHSTLLALPRWRARNVQWALGFFLDQGKSSP